VASATRRIDEQKLYATLRLMRLSGLRRHWNERLLADLGAPVVDVVDDRAHVADTPGFRHCAVKLAR
jgi:hypothetical protein